VDPLVQPVSTNNQFGSEFLHAIELIMSRFEGVHTMCGLSNISYGLPKREFLNQNFMVMALSKGLDGAIVNPLDKKMMAGIIAAETLTGKDNFCIQYITAFRAKKLEF
jgi:5-methyltetrahydrofolate--homocysteine methyltransferase